MNSAAKARTRLEEAAPTDYVVFFRSIRCSSLTFALRAPGDPVLLEVAKDAALRRIVEHDPGHQCSYHENRDHIGGDDEIGMWSEIHAFFLLHLIISETRHPLFWIMRLPLRISAPATIVCSAHDGGGFHYACLRGGESRIAA